VIIGDGIQSNLGNRVVSVTTPRAAAPDALHTEQQSTNHPILEHRFIDIL